MKYFFKTLIFIPIIGCLIFFIFLFFTIYVVPVNDNSYSLAHIDKIKMLDTSKKKIVLFGGSNVAFGFKSDLLEEKFPEYDIINAGTHASLGMRYPLKEIKEKLNEGDVLIIFPEYDQFNGGYGGTPLFEVCLYKKNFKNLEFKEFLSGIQHIKDFFLTQLNSRVSSKMYGKGFVYDRRGFNKNGDYIEHYKFKIKNNLECQPFTIKEIDKSILQFFYSIKSELEKKNVKVLFFPPVFQKSSALMSLKEIKKISEEMETNKTPFLSKPEIYFLEDKDFYDTIYHLNEKGGEIRTKKLIKDLKNNFTIEWLFVK